MKHVLFGKGLLEQKQYTAEKLLAKDLKYYIILRPEKKEDKLKWLDIWIPRNYNKIGLSSVSHVIKLPFWKRWH